MRDERCLSKPLLAAGLRYDEARDVTTRDLATVETTEVHDGAHAAGGGFVGQHRRLDDDPIETTVLDDRFLPSLS